MFLMFGWRDGNSRRLFAATIYGNSRRLFAATICRFAGAALLSRFACVSKCGAKSFYSASGSPAASLRSQPPLQRLLCRPMLGRRRRAGRSRFQFLFELVQVGVQDVVKLLGHDGVGPGEELRDVITGP